MLRSAAKNYQSVAVVPDPKFYSRIIKELKEESGCLSHNLLRELAVEVFKLTARYDSIIAGFLRQKLGPPVLSEDPLPEILSTTLTKVASLRYGENPHQKAGLYRLPDVVSPSLVGARQLHGKELSFNNYLDLNAALAIIREFSQPAVCIIKHNNIFSLYNLS